MFYYLRSIIIVLIKLIIPASLLLLIAPKLVHLSKPLNELQTFLQTYQITFLISHLLFYFLLYILWPRFIQVILYHKNHEITPAQMLLALSARWYLLGILFFLETLVWWR
ncbi:hypothetical protein ACQUW5_02340 [Legionella sp. CNM-1927-20]|uniref:hypothetical protein n=1 Tax=Legionella sp. CNM-1927-20 TaxID=3422221 RepID=UPI00403AB5F6